MQKEGKALRAVPLGRVLVAFLQQYFAQYIDYDFTSHLELQLDEVAGALPHPFCALLCCAVLCLAALSSCACVTARLPCSCTAVRML